MERDKDTGYVVKEVGSFEVNEGARYIKNFYVNKMRLYSRILSILSV